MNQSDSLGRWKCKEKWDNGRQEPASDGTTDCSMTAFQLGTVGNAKES